MDRKINKLQFKLFRVLNFELHWCSPTCTVTDPFSVQHQIHGYIIAMGDKLIRFAVLHSICSFLLFRWVCFIVGRILVTSTVAPAIQCKWLHGMQVRFTWIMIKLLAGWAIWHTVICFRQRLVAERSFGRLYFIAATIFRNVGIFKKRLN